MRPADRCRDSTLNTPLVLRAVDYGADIVHALGHKYLAGHSDCSWARWSLGRRRSAMPCGPGAT